MDYKYARFVAYATLVAQEQLREVLAGRNMMPGLDMIKDAARIGVRRARERIFPGLGRDPFSINPLDDVVLGLRYHYDLNPNNATADPSGSHASGTSSAGSWNASSSANAAAGGGPPSSQRVTVPSPTPMPRPADPAMPPRYSTPPPAPAPAKPAYPFSPGKKPGS